MKSLLDKGFIGMDMPPLPDDLWKGLRLLPLTETFVYSTSSDTYATWSIPENEPITTQGENRCNGIIRWYDPITGRWLSNDPIGISGGLNQYVFCANNPVNRRDPSGRCTGGGYGGGQNTVNNVTGNIPYTPPYTPSLPDTFISNPTPGTSVSGNDLLNGMMNPPNPNADNLISTLGGNTAYTGMDNTGLAQGSLLPAVANGVVGGLGAGTAYGYALPYAPEIIAGTEIVSGALTPGPSTWPGSIGTVASGFWTYVTTGHF